MKARYTVRKHQKHVGYWSVWDRLENREVRSYAHDPSAKSLCKCMNKGVRSA
jgi:hypothetical protein